MSAFVDIPGKAKGQAQRHKDNESSSGPSHSFGVNWYLSGSSEVVVVGDS